LWNFSLTVHKKNEFIWLYSGQGKLKKLEFHRKIVRVGRPAIVLAKYRGSVGITTLFPPLDE